MQFKKKSTKYNSFIIHKKYKRWHFHFRPPYSKSACHIFKNKNKSNDTAEPCKSRQICRRLRCLRNFVLKIHDKMLDIKNAGQGRRVRHLQWCYSMVNIQTLQKTYDALFGDSSQFPRSNRW